MNLLSTTSLHTSVTCSNNSSIEKSAQKAHFSLLRRGETARKRRKRENVEIEKLGARRGATGKGCLPSDPRALQFSLPSLHSLNVPLARLCSLYFDYQRSLCGERGLTVVYLTQAHFFLKVLRNLSLTSDSKILLGMPSSETSLYCPCQSHCPS